MNSHTVHENTRLDDDEIKPYTFATREGGNVPRRVQIKTCLFLRSWKTLGNLTFPYMPVFFQGTVVIFVSRTNERKTSTLPCVKERPLVYCMLMYCSFYKAGEDFDRNEEF